MTEEVGEVIVKQPLDAEQKQIKPVLQPSEPQDRLLCTFACYSQYVHPLLVSCYILTALSNCIWALAENSMVFHIIPTYRNAMYPLIPTLSIFMFQMTTQTSLTFFMYVIIISFDVFAALICYFSALHILQDDMLWENGRVSMEINSVLSDQNLMYEFVLWIGGALCSMDVIKNVLQILVASPDIMTSIHANININILSITSAFAIICVQIAEFAFSITSMNVPLWQAFDSPYFILYLGATYSLLVTEFHNVHIVYIELFLLALGVSTAIAYLYYEITMVEHHAVWTSPTSYASMFGNQSTPWLANTYRYVTYSDFPHVFVVDFAIKSGQIHELHQYSVMFGVALLTSRMCETVRDVYHAYKKNTMREFMRKACFLKNSPKVEDADKTE